MRRTRASLATIVIALAAVAGGTLLAAACAQGSEGVGDDDDDEPGPDANEVQIDAPPGQIDARPIDASLPIDAPFPIDAAPPIDAPPTGACTTTADCAAIPLTCCNTLSPPAMCVPGFDIGGICFPLS
jgi:hypothetical protein